jgi:hypothetical protein
MKKNVFDFCRPTPAVHTNRHQHGKGTFWGSRMYVFSGGSPRADNGDIQVCCIGGSIINKYGWFAIHRTEAGGFDYKMPSSAGIFTAKLTLLFGKLQHIEEMVFKF